MVRTTTHQSRWRVSVGVTLLLLLLASCSAGANTAAGSTGDVAGFWLGLWHGFISPITLWISLLNDRVNIYEVNNNGGWYNVGFVLGVSIFFGAINGSGRAQWATRRASRRDAAE